ncbi:MAG: hypothetical protein NTU63_00760 [Candidatus Pacearchaeota archaeon]|nr:hypothetical protein [Candidatus Pacearchaeota archaeon]
MASAKLIKALEKEGFFIEFPSYETKEEMIMEIIKENNPRLSMSISLFLRGSFDYKGIIKKLNKEEIKRFNKFLLISEKIYNKENLQNDLKEIIKENKIKASFSKEEFDNSYDSFKEAQPKRNQAEQKIIEKQTKLRLNLDLNKSLGVLFSPAKIKIMEKIFNHEKLTNTELKYYYKAISNINRSVLNPSLQDYLKIIELAKKEVMKNNKPSLFT